MTSDNNAVEVEVKKKKRKRLTCKEIGEKFYDKKEGTFLGRTGKDWGFLFIFLVLFYSILAGYFALLFTIFIRGIVPPGIPFRTGSNSLVGFLPGFSARPLQDSTSKILTVSSNSSSYFYGNYTNNFGLFSKSYLQNKINVLCNNSMDMINDTCSFNPSELGPCSNGNASLLNGQLCVYLHINNIYGWMPKLVNNAPDVLVRCIGSNDTDNSNIGPINYHPNQTYNNDTYGVFRNVYFPFLNKPNYLSPVVAVQFLNLAKNQLVNVVCTLVNLLNVGVNSITIPVQMVP